MGRLEKQIISGAVALVAILLVVVLVKGIEPTGPQNQTEKKSEWQDPALLLSNLQPKTGPNGGDSLKAGVVDLGGPEPGVGNSAAEHGYAGADPNKSQLKQGVPTVKDTPAPGENLGQQDLIQKAIQKSSERGEASPASSSNAAAMVNLDWDEELRVYKVRKNESLSEIAQRELGSMKYLDSILELNEGLSANNIRAGQEIWLPSANNAKANYELSRSAKSKAKPQASTTSSGRTHKVVSGDSLWRIAKKYYPKMDRKEAIQRIVQANSVLKSDNSVLELGMELQIPR